METKKKTKNELETDTEKDVVEVDIVEIEETSPKTQLFKDQQEEMSWGNVSEEMDVIEACTDVYTHRFSKPFEYQGKKAEKISFDFGAMSGQDMLDVEREMQACQEFSVGAEVSKMHQCKLVARAANYAKEDNGFVIGSDVIAALPMRDFNTICNKARNFLLDIG